MHTELPLPPYFESSKVAEVWRVPYQERARQAARWRREYGVKPASKDKFQVSLMLVDVQNTFCIPDYELFVAGQSGKGAVEDNRRLCAFIYKSLPWLTQICPTMDTHQPMQIFHSIFLVDKKGEHPAPATLVSVDDIRNGKWLFNKELCDTLEIDKKYGQNFLRHYVTKLYEHGKYELMVWPYHAMLGGIGHALVASVEEAVFFHGIARYSQPDYQMKGNNPLTENYSVLSPEVLEDHEGNAIAYRNTSFVQKLLQFDAVVIAGQAKSHCVASTIDDLLKVIQTADMKLAERVYLLEDCMSPVVIPGIIDTTEAANAAFDRFADAGMNIVQSTTPIYDWPGMQL